MNLQMKDPVTGAVPELRQWYFFRESLIEKYGEVDEYQIAVDHEQGKCYYDGKEYGVIFPRKILKFVPEPIKAADNRDLAMCFKGKYNPNRNWINAYRIIEPNHIEWTDRGREIGKSVIDGEYMNMLSSSTMALSPAGDYLWTYRFFEACFAGAIPIIKAEEESPLYDGYVYLEYTGNGWGRVRADFANKNMVQIRLHNYYEALKRNLLPL